MPPNAEPPGKPRIKVYTRETAPGANDRVELVLDRLEQLHRAKTIQEYEVHKWTARSLVDSGDGRSPIGEIVAPFEDWADSHGVSIHPPFDRHRVEVPLIGEDHEVIVLPVCCLAVYREDTLEAVVPHTEQGRTRTVDAYLTDLEALDDRVSGNGEPLSTPPS